MTSSTCQKKKLNNITSNKKINKNRTKKGENILNSKKEKENHKIRQRRKEVEKEQNNQNRT